VVLVLVQVEVAHTDLREEEGGRGGVSMGHRVCPGVLLRQRRDGLATEYGRAGVREEQRSGYR